MGKERVILHCDLNNFYASVECRYDPRLREVPMAVGGSEENRHGIVLAKNELAKQFGIKTAETLWQARQKCPELMVVPPHYERYYEVSGQPVPSMPGTPTASSPSASTNAGWI